MAFDLEQLMQNPLFQTGLATLGGSAPNRAGLLNAYNAIQNRKKLEMEAQQQAQQMELEKARSELYREQIATSKRKLEQEAKGWELAERYMGKQGQGIVPQPAAIGQSPAALAPAAPAAPSAAFFDTADKFVLDIEGGFVPNDAGKGPTNQGVNQRANPDINVKNAPPEVLQQRRRQYWDAIGADKLDPNTAMVAYDSAINQGQGYAKELLGKTTDPNMMIYQRRQDYRALAKSNPLYKQYLPGWEARLDKLAEQVKSGAAQPTTAPVAAGPEQPGPEIVPEIQIGPTGPRVELKQSYERAKMQQSAQQHQENLQLRRQEEARKQAESERVAGTAAQARTEAKTQDWRNFATTSANLDLLASKVTELSSHPGTARIYGPIGAVPDIPGTPASDARAIHKSVVSQIAKETLQAVRDASKTGGAFGNVSDKDVELLQTAIVNLGNAQSTESARKAMEEVVKYTTRIRNIAMEAFEKTYGESPIQGLQRGARLEGFDPKTRKPYYKLPNGKFVREE